MKLKPTTLVFSKPVHRTETGYIIYNTDPIKICNFYFKQFSILYIINPLKPKSV
jgi:hypothetical protein